MDVEYVIWATFLAETITYLDIYCICIEWENLIKALAKEIY